MSEIDDGVIKFDQSHFVQTKPLEDHEYRDLEKWRKTLYNLQLIGEYQPEKIGYGNISARKDYSKFKKNSNPQFLITGTQTGKFADLSGEHYSRVVDYDFEKNILEAHGPIQSSSEGLTHAAIYEVSEQITAVFHIHSLQIWEEMLKANAPHTHKDIPYGTIDMAKATQELIKGKTSGVFAMAGHKEGIFSFGRDLEEAGKLILEIYDKFKR